MHLGSYHGATDVQKTLLLVTSPGKLFISIPLGAGLLASVWAQGFCLPWQCRGRSWREFALLAVAGVSLTVAFGVG